MEFNYTNKQFPGLSTNNTISEAKVTNVPSVFNSPNVNKGLGNITYTGYSPDGKFITSSNAMDFTPGGIVGTAGYGDNKQYAGTGDNWSVLDSKTGGLVDKSNTSMFGDVFGADGFGFNKGTLQGLGQIGNLASGVAGIYLGNKQLGLAKDKFAFDKDMLTKQYNMAKDAYDRQVERTGNIDRKIQAGKAVR
jgi:hypothetical protein